MEDAVAAARRIADDVLFPRANDTDRARVVPLENLDALADAGLYGLTGPPASGGADADFATVCSVTELLSSGCLTTAFVHAQHIGAVHAVATSDTEGLADEWLAPLCRGERRAGLALAGALPGRPLLRAVARGGLWELTGSARWISGWGRIDVVHTAARTDDGRVVWLLADARESESFHVRRLELTALDATATVRADYTQHTVRADRVTSIVPHEEGPPNPYVLRIHASFALGVVARACTLIGPTPLDDELTRCRDALDAEAPEALVDAMPAARAAVSELALRATAALMVRMGSESVVREQHAQRLAREALFLAVYASRPEVRSALLTLLRSPAS